MPPKKKLHTKRGRVEFLAEPEWIDLVTACARRSGVNGISAYIRMCVNKQMAIDWPEKFQEVMDTLSEAE